MTTTSIPLYHYLALSTADRAALPHNVVIDLTAAEPGEASRFPDVAWDRERTGEMENGEWNA